MLMFKHHRESGAVSLFLVIFAMLLITIVTLGFLRIMLNDQQQASAADLSKSAYDSSLAGIEDAKRALIYYRTVCATSDTAACSDLRNRINSGTCNAGLSDVVTVTPNKEVMVQQQQSGNDDQLNQAYTCVKINLETDDYLGTIQANSSKIIPLSGTKNFSSVTVEWYSADDLGTNSTAVNLLPDASLAQPLYLQSNWVASRPSLLRTQLMQFGSNFALGSFDAASASMANSNANTLFLYPTGTSGSARSVKDSWSFTGEDIRQFPTGSPQPTRCSGNLSGGGYACRVTLTLPQAVGQNNDNRTAYLRLTPLYNSSHFRVILGDGAKFSAIQPSIDSTGRANDLYRRVEARVDLVDTAFPYPEATVDLTGDFCKDFVVTDVVGQATTTCTP